MFLIYCSKGRRDYGGKQTVHALRRKVWEFQFIFDGSCIRLNKTPKGLEQETMPGPMLVISGPDSVHGWSGQPGRKCSVFVFHFDEAAYPLKQIIDRGSYRALPFLMEDLAKVETLYERGMTAKRLPDSVSLVTYDIIALELTLFFLDRIPRAELPVSVDRARNKVIEAQAWYQANLAHGPEMVDIARAVHLSPAHLRRLFHQVRGMPPQAAFALLQFERARELMLDQTLALECIAERSGFSTASVFSRAFKNEFGVPPRIYRSRLLETVRTQE